MRAESSRILKRFLTWVFPVVLLGLSQPACHLLQKQEAKTEAASPAAARHVHRSPRTS